MLFCSAHRMTVNARVAVLRRTPLLRAIVRAAGPEGGVPTAPARWGANDPALRTNLRFHVGESDLTVATKSSP